MRQILRGFVVLLVFVAAEMLAPSSLWGYGGPGSIISGLGAFLAVVAAIIVSIFGFLWFPLKRLIRRIRGESDRDAETRSGEAPEDLAAE